MRMLVYVTFPIEPFNTYVRDGSAGAKLNKVIEAIKPESIYFTEMDHGRGCVMVIDVADPSKVPVIAEPWFLLFNAKIQTRICMTPADLQKSGLDTMAKNWK